MQRTGPQTNARESIILAAERLFAERGFAGVSLREIGALAGQRNNSASQYHFGTKHGLVDAVFRFRMEAINAERVAMLEAFDQIGLGHDPRSLIEAFTHPLADQLGRQQGVSFYARFLRQIALDPSFDPFAPERHDVSSGLMTIASRFPDCLPDLPMVIRLNRIDLAMRSIVHALADHERAVEADRQRRPTPIVVADVIDAAVAIVEAPISLATAQVMHRVTAEQPSPQLAAVKVSRT